uniref:flagellin N-terminal helical domain-containing protein n=1 Tax=Eubacterium cellulosolvens TaxID=29322 RepID=UPI0004853C21|nr:flagellin [[Eubacterium] cellulosolvens]
MVIQHNIPATNAYRNLTSNRSGLSKNLEKLSAGYRINRAADDAAGLAISEAMRSKINGLEQATANANDAIGLIQTEEGALTETHSMLQRMTTLATQAANGTYNSTARASIQKEMNELGDEIDRIANNTDYNGIKPLAEASNKGTNIKNNSDLLNMTMQIGPTKGEVLDLKGHDMTLKGIFKDLDTIERATGAHWYCSTFTGIYDVLGNWDTVTGDFTEDNRLDLDQSKKDLVHAVKVAAAKEGIAVPSSFFVTVNVSNSDNNYIVDVNVHNAGNLFASSLSWIDNPMITALREAFTAIDGVQKCKGEVADHLTDGKEYIQVTSSGVDGDDVTSNANRVIQNIQSAINHVSRYRAELGAKQNRLEHTINNLQVTSENTIAAESRIRDTDMAKEMAAYTKNNILSQAAQSMLAQANQTGQGVLSLLQ